MDSMRKLETLMRSLAEKEASSSSPSLARFRACSSALSSFLGEEDYNEHEAGQLRLRMEHEGAHYEQLISACMERMTAAARLPEAIREIVISMTDDIRVGYSLYLDAYCTLYDAFAAFDLALCERAESLACEGDHRIEAVQRVIESTREELPLVA